MDKDKTLKVNWKEWREYHLLNPSGHSMHDIIQFWRHSNVSDFDLFIFMTFLRSLPTSAYYEF